MASIDKIYGNKKQYNQLYKWLVKNHPAWLIYLYSKPDGSYKYDFPISNFPTDVDRYLLNNCPLEFVKEKIKEMYNLNGDF